tara:strand:- start:634 stop:753 length:120 start_codon:yes stop_codon:yes gene_type:complete
MNQVETAIKVFWTIVGTIVGLTLVTFIILFAIALITAMG